MGSLRATGKTPAMAALVLAMLLALAYGPWPWEGELSPTAEAATASAVQGVPLLYPDLRTLPIDDLSFSTEEFDGDTYHLLRFTNSVWNAGEGPLELRQVAEDDPRVFQRIYGSDGSYSDRLAGTFMLHEDHNHWHFEDFAGYELWNRSTYDRWVASGRTTGTAEWQMGKTSSCLMDNDQVSELPGSPSDAVYPESCPREGQGISVGWADIYGYELPEQWIDLGPNPLPDGRYVLRSVVDPLGLIHESEGGGNSARESEAANEAVVAFSVEDEDITVEESVRSGG